MGCEGGPKGTSEGITPGIRRIAAFRRVEGPQGEVRSETLVPYGEGLRVVSTIPVRRVERSFSGGSAPEPSPVGVSRFHDETPVFDGLNPVEVPGVNGGFR